VRLARPGDVVLVLFEKLAPMMSLLASMGAGPGEMPIGSLGRAPTTIAAPARDLLSDTPSVLT
jgi:cyanophycin synthetase